MDKLSLVELADLKSLEAVIEKGKQTFVDVGQALGTIQEKKLYREKFDTFEEYCKERWNWSRQYATNVINASGVVAALPQKLSTMVDNERAARALAKVPPKERAKVLREAVAKSDGPPTGKQIEEVAKQSEGPKVVTDGGGYPIPRTLLPLWERRHELTAMMTTLSRVKCALSEAHENGDKLLGKVDQSAVDRIEAAYHSISEALPERVCGVCQGRLETKKDGYCKACGSTGFMSEYEYKTFVPEETRTLREAGLMKKK